MERAAGHLCSVGDRCHDRTNWVLRSAEKPVLGSGVTGVVRGVWVDSFNGPVRQSDITQGRHRAYDVI